MPKGYKYTAQNETECSIKKF